MTTQQQQQVEEHESLLMMEGIIATERFEPTYGKGDDIEGMQAVGAEPRGEHEVHEGTEIAQMQT